MRMTMLLLALSLIVLFGCSSPGSNGTGQDTQADTGSDAAADAVPQDALSDSSPDTAPDIPQQDTPAVDAGPDLLPDTVLPDTGADTLPDSQPDTVKDTASDTIPDGAGADTCQPDCDGKECGDDGCGGSCGVCDDEDLCTDDSCSEVGQCVFADNGDCPVECDGPNPEGCISTGCAPGEVCTSVPGICVPSACACDTGSGSWVCTPDCSGGICVCQPDCEGKECGDNGCTGSCGECLEHFACQESACVYQPWCGDLTCDDGLLEDCSTCPTDCPCGCGETCADGTCTFTACDGKECGEDGCGGSCGECPDDPCFAVCISGTCSHEATAPEMCNGQDDDCDGEIDEADAEGCTGYYHDGDGDGFGDIADSLCLCVDTAPEGFTTDAADCCDADASVHPGQAAWFTTASDLCGGSWDFNCVNGVEYEHGQTVGFCGGFLSCTGPVGWKGSPAGCGQQKAWVTGCSLGVFTCDEDAILKTQGCH